MTKPKIFITGGHLTPAVAIFELLIAKGYQIWYIGRKYAQEEDTSISIEYQTLISYKGKVNLLLITTGKLQRYLNFSFVFSLLKIPIGFLQSLYWIITIRPNIILSFGGYVAVPISVSAFLFRIPIVTHEQTHSCGFANKLIGKIADKVCLSWEDSKNCFDKSKTVVTGLPIRKSVFNQNKSFPIICRRPLIYITGGSLGSHTINLLFIPIIKKLLEDFSIIHQCGQTKKYNDYQTLLRFKAKLPKDLQKSYYPVTYIEEDYLGWVYKKAAFAVGRAGANTVYEFSAVGLPAIFIPIPFASGNEQLLNAKFFAGSGAGYVLSQNNLTSDALYEEIIEFKRRLAYFKDNAEKLKKKISVKGAENLVSVLECEKLGL